MMSIEYIRDMAEEAGKKAKQHGKFACAHLRDGADIRGLGSKHTIPFIGTHGEWMDENFKQVCEPLFVDSSGFGSEAEPAMAQGQFTARLTALLKEHGPLYVGVVEAGQFQCYVGIWAASLGPETKE